MSMSPVSANVFRACTLTALVLTVSPALRPAHGAPVPTYPALALLRDPTFIPISFTGIGFGSPTTGAKLTIDDGTGLLVDIPAGQLCDPPTVSHTCIVFWSDDWITAKLESSLTRASVRITTAAAGTTAFLRLHYYQYLTYDTDPDVAELGTNPSPHTIVVNASGFDPQRTVWIGEEFHLGFKKWTAAQGSVTLQSIAVPSPPPFGSTIFPTIPVPMAQTRQGTIDPYGRAWVTETGQPFYAGAVPNHARVWMFAGAEARAYNIPGDYSALTGIAYEANYAPGRDRVWYTVRRRRIDSFGPIALNARLGWFDVDDTAPCVGGQCRFGQSQACSTDDNCPLWNDGTTSFTPTAACARSCNDINFPGEACASDGDCLPQCIDGQCLLGKPGACSTDEDCAAECGFPFTGCLNGTGQGCFNDSHCVPKCSAGFCSDNAARGCLVSGDCWASTIVCDWDDPNPSCRFHEYVLPDDSDVPGYIGLGLDPVSRLFDGRVWIADYIGSSLRRVDTLTGLVTSYPLGDDPGLPSVPWFLGSNPFGMYTASNGDPIVAEYSDATLNRFDASRADDPACLALDPSEQNPCVTSLIPQPAASGDYRVHSIAPHDSGSTWFTMEGPQDPASRATVGFVTPDWMHIALFPPLSLYPFDTSTLEGTNESLSLYCDVPGNFRAFAGAGIDLDSNTHEVFFAEYCRKRLGHLRPHTSNLALARPALQSSTWCNPSGHCGPASAAVDGSIDGTFPLGSVAHTFDTNRPWWEVDLSASYPIDAIEIWNRTDCCSFRLQNFYVFVSNDPFTSTDPTVLVADPNVLSIYQQAEIGSRFTTDVRRSGRYVRVQLAGNTEPLQLAEVVVLGRPMVTNRALAGTATQSSTWCNFSGCHPAGAAIDDNTDGNMNTGLSVSHTLGGPAAWWQVDLGASYQVEELELWNRTDCCGSRLENFYVFLSDSPFVTTDPNVTPLQPGVTTIHHVQPVGTHVSFPVDRTVRYIRVQLISGEPLQLAEVVVFGQR